MSAVELLRMMDTWSDALNVAEVVGSPYLRVTEHWDLHDWQAVELLDSVMFQRVEKTGQVAEEVVVVSGGEGREVMGPVAGPWPGPLWVLQVEAEGRMGT